MTKRFFVSVIEVLYSIAASAPSRSSRSRVCGGSGARAGIMPITYIPADFWGVACTVTGSAIPKVMWRSTYMGIPGVLAALCGHFRHELNDLLCPVEDDQCVYDVPGSFITPFALLVALLTSYRVNGAHAKWDNANKMAMSLHEVRDCCAPRPTDPQHLSSPQLAGSRVYWPC